MVFMGKNRTILHELEHSYGLYHTFIQNELSINSPHTFFRGYTDNIMDYQSFQLPQDVIDKWRANPTTKKPDNNNPRMNTMFALFKWHGTSSAKTIILSNATGHSNDNLPKKQYSYYILAAIITIMYCERLV